MNSSSVLNRYRMLFLFIILFVPGSRAVSSTACNSEAPLPKPNYRPVWSQLRGTWYETLKSVDVTNSQHACMSLSYTDATRKSGGLLVPAEYYYEDGSRVKFNIHGKYTKDGYVQQARIEANEDIALKGGPSYSQRNTKIAAGTKDVEMAITSSIGDFQHYQADVWCSDGTWKVWIFTKTKVLTPDSIVYIHNDLMKYGISVPLQLGKCENM